MNSAWLTRQGVRGILNLGVTKDSETPSIKLGAQIMMAVLKSISYFSFSDIFLYLLS